MTAIDIAAVYDQLVQISDKVATVHAEVCEIRGACLPCQKRVDRLEITIEGNGAGAGLKGDVVSLKQGRIVRKTLGTSAVAIVSAIIGAVFQWVVAR